MNSIRWWKVKQKKSPKTRKTSRKIDGTFYVKVWFQLLIVQYEFLFSRGYHRSMISIINYGFQQCEPEHWWLISWHYIQLFWQFIYLFRCILYLYSVKNFNPYSSPSQPCYYYYYYYWCCCCYNSWVVVVVAVDKNKCGQDSFLCNKLILLIQQKLTAKHTCTTAARQSTEW